MKWEDERYTRLYTRDTTNWVLGPWESRAVLPLAMRKLDRSGALDLGEDGLEGLAALVRMPIEIVDAGMAWWFKKGTFEIRGTVLVMTHYREAQEARASDKKRAKDKRDRERLDAELDADPCDVFGHVVTTRDRSSRSVTGESHGVTDRHTSSRSVTPSLAEPSLTNLPPNPPTGEGLGRADESGVIPAAAVVARVETTLSGRPLPASEGRQWGALWIDHYERAVVAELGRPWAFDAYELATLEKALGSFCDDKVRIPDWIDRAVRAFVKAVRADDPKLWSSYQPKGLRRWFNETGGLRSASPAVEGPAVLAERARREQERLEAERHAAPMPEALRKLAGGIGRALPTGPAKSGAA